MNFSRRDILKYGLAGAGSCFLPFNAFARNNIEDHFLYVLFLDGGADFTYLFDARPLEMTDAKLLSNHVGEEPIEWKGQNGGQTLASALTHKLKPLTGELAIVNGVFMDPTFFGHPNVLNLLFSGSPFMADSFLPWINSMSKTHAEAPLNGIKKGFTGSGEVNQAHASLIALEGGDAGNLVKRLETESKLSQSSSAWDFSRSRFKHIAGLSQGHFSQGSNKLFNASAAGQDLSNRFATLDLSSLNADPDLRFLDLFSKMAKKGMLRSSLEVTDQFNLEAGQIGGFPLDSHAIASGTDHKAMYERVVDKIGNTIRFFKDTPYDGVRSMLDVTTLMIATEFGRTMRQDFVEFEECGTDHNPFCNSFLFAGKGIKGGTVIGESDFRTSKESLSGAHLQLDKNKLHIMAKPFDLSNEHVTSAKPEVFQMDHYLTSGSVMNTLFSLFGLPQDLYRKKSQNGPSFPILKSLIR